MVRSHHITSMATTPIHYRAKLRQRKNMRSLRSSCSFCSQQNQEIEVLKWWTWEVCTIDELSLVALNQTWYTIETLTMYAHMYSVCMHVLTNLKRHLSVWGVVRGGVGGGDAGICMYIYIYMKWEREEEREITKTFMVFCNETGEVYELLSCILFSLTAPVVNISEVYTFYRYLFFSTFSPLLTFFFLHWKRCLWKV